MGKRNPFSSWPNRKNKLLMITNLNGQIVHTSGGSHILKSSHRQLYLKNFIKDLLSFQSCQNLYTELQSTQILPTWINKRHFKCKIKTGRKRIIDQELEKQFKVSCYRIFIKFSKKLISCGKVPIKSLSSGKQFAKLKDNKQYEEAIAIYIEPVANQLKNTDQNEKQQSTIEKTNEEKQKIQLQKTKKITKAPIYQTPEKQKTNQEKLTKSTGKTIPIIVLGPQNQH